MTETGATISWTTDEASNSQVEYGEDTNYGNNTTLNTNMVTSHSQGLTSLTANTTYHYRVKSEDASGNLAVSGDYTFTTLAPDETPPVISNVTSSNVTSGGATISWDTDEASDSQVEYGLDTGYGSSTTLNTSMVTSHSETISGLVENTVYHYRVKSKDASGNESVSADYTFTTASAPSYVQRVNAGGGNYSGGGKDWAADQEYSTGSWGYVSGRTYSTNDNISNTPDDPLYQSERYRMSEYRFTVPSSGMYEVVLHFAEIFYNDPNKRYFDVKLEGNRVLNDLDIYAIVGHDFAYTQTFNVQVSDGVLNIEFVKEEDSQKVSAIEVSKVTVGENLTKKQSNRSINEEQQFEPLPEFFTISNPYPNPFNMETQIKLELPEYGYVFVAIYNIRGQEIRKLVNENLMPGQQMIRWNGRDEYGTDVSSGIYLLKLVFISENGIRESAVKRLVLMK